LIVADEPEVRDFLRPIFARVHERLDWRIARIERPLSLTET